MPDDLPDSVSTAIDAVNAGDADTFVAAFADDGVVDDFGREFRGHDAIRSWSDDELIGVNATLDVDGVSTTDAETEVHAQVGGDGFNGPSTFTFKTTDDAIGRMTIRE